MKKYLLVILCLALSSGVFLSGCSVSTRTTKVVTTSQTSTRSDAATQTSTASPLSFIVAEPAPLSSDSTSSYQPPPLTDALHFSVITAGLEFDPSQSGTQIPWGSTIYHWKNGITEIIGPDNSLIFVAKDAEATQIITPGGGPRPATGIYGLPNGGMVSPDPDNKNITKITLGSTLLATIVNKPEPFPYAPTQLQNTTQQFTALGIYADGITKVITSQVIWSSSNIVIATISSDGLVTGLADGTTNITASLFGVTSLEVVMTINSLSSVSVVTWNGVGIPLPFNNQPVDFTWQLGAAGSYSDGSTIDVTSEVTWNSSNSAVATVSTSGLVNNIAPGITEITASLDGATSPVVDWNVSAASTISTNAP